MWRAGLELEDHLDDLEWYTRSNNNQIPKPPQASACGSSAYTYHLFPPKNVEFAVGEEVNS
jgi:hypothetical protein